MTSNTSPQGGRVTYLQENVVRPMPGWKIGRAVHAVVLVLKWCVIPRNNWLIVNSYVVIISTPALARLDLRVAYRLSERKIAYHAARPHIVWSGL